MRPLKFLKFLTILILIQSGSAYYLPIQDPYGKSTFHIAILEDLNGILSHMKKELNLTSVNGLYQKQRQHWSLIRLLK